MGKNKNQINVKLTDEQLNILKSLVGVMGGTDAEVIRNIYLAWLSEHQILTEIIRKKMK